MGIAPIVILVVVLLFVAFLVMLRRGVGFRLRGRGSRQRHIVVRIICGSLGLLILVAIAVGTWHEARFCYLPDKAARVRVPSREPPPAPEIARGHQVAADGVRVLLRLVVVDTSFGGRRPVVAHTFDVRWPEDRGRPFEAAVDLAGSAAVAELVVQDLNWSKRYAAQPTLEARTQLSFRGHDWVSSRGASGPLTDGPRMVLTRAPRWARKNRPLSAVATWQPGFAVVMFSTRVAPDDPLREVGLAEFFGERDDRVRELVAAEVPDRRADHRPPAEIPARGVALAEHIGASSLLLLGAALLLIQLFRRRGLAFAGLLTALVLYVAVLDRAVLDMHLSRLRDPEAPVATRLVACRRAFGTFFYRQRMLEAMEQVADDEQAPERLRDHARRAPRGPGS